MGALAIGSAVVGGAQKIGSNRRGDDADANAQASIDAAIGEMGKVTDTLDALKPTIDAMAQRGQDAYDRDQAMFNPMEENLNDFFLNLDSGRYAAQQNQSATDYSQKVNQGVSDQLYAQNVLTPAMKAQMDMTSGHQLGNTKAQNDFDAVDKVANMQSGWMNYGAGQQAQSTQQMQQGVNAQSNLANQYGQAYTNMANIYGGQAAGYNDQTQNYYNQGNQALSSGMMGLGYFGDKAWGAKK